MQRRRKMDTIEYNGQTYTRRHSKWIDSDNLAVCESLQKTLNRIYLESTDLSSYSVEDLIAEGDKFNNSSSYQSAIRFYEKALEDCDADTYNYILPRITSCYRKCNMPRKVIDLFSEIQKGYDGEPSIFDNISSDDLIYYGLEYKFITQYVIGQLSYDEMVSQLEIAIHQFAKRQMTWFRGMEKRRGFKIDWIQWNLSEADFAETVINKLVL